MRGSGLLLCKTVNGPLFRGSQFPEFDRLLKPEMTRSSVLGKAMRRRDFITGLSRAGVAWPLAPHAQQPAMPVIGFLHRTSFDNNRENLATFRRGLGDTRFSRRVTHGGHER